MSGNTLVVVLGWWKSHPKQVRKYADIYSSHPSVFKVVQHTMTTREMLLVHPLRTSRARKVLDEINDVKQEFQEQHAGETPRLAFHAMSNNGSFLYMTLRDMMRRKKEYKWMLQNTDRIVFDSTPGELNGVVGLGALFESGSPKVVKWSVGLSLVVGMAGMKQMSGSYPSFFRNLVAFVLISRVFEHLITMAYHHKFTHDPIKCPRLFLYSKEDNLVSYRSIRSCMKTMETNGYPIQSHCFNGSAHVAHFRQFPSEYISTIHNFLQR